MVVSGLSTKSMGLTPRKAHMSINSPDLKSLSLDSFIKLLYRDTYGIPVSLDNFDKLNPFSFTYRDKFLVGISTFLPPFAKTVEFFFSISYNSSTGTAMPSTKERGNVTCQIFQWITLIKSESP